MQPNNTNQLHPNKFTVSFARIPTVQYFCQVVSLPGLTLGEAAQPTPFIDRYVPGDKIIYDYLTMTFIVDEELETFFQIHDWIIGMGFPKDFQQYKDLGPLSQTYIAASKTPQYSDATLTVNDSNHNPRFRFSFKDCFPTSLSSLVFNTQESPENPMTADVTFRYLLYTVDRLRTS